MKSLALNSYAKVNLSLEVINKRKDNYHNLRIIFERIDLSDKIILKSRSDKEIKVTCNNSNVPKNRSNLCYRSAEALRDIFKIEKGLDIKIIKRIPVGAGLGGGSSNAATVLSGLNKFWRLNVSKKRLVEIAKRIGCDVPFFIYDVSFAKALGRGDEIKPLGALKDTKFWHILVVPKILVSTPFIYKKWDTDSGLTTPPFDVKLLTSTLKKNALSLRGEHLFNSLESIAVKYYPQVKIIKEKLRSLGLKKILMSGSGPAVFGIVSTRKEAVTLARKMRDQDKSLQVFVTRTI